jgi:peptide/nickel transport system substrate-binding protein
MTSGIFNPFQLTSPELTELVTAVGLTPVAEQSAALEPVNDFFLEEVWIAPVSYVTGKYAAANTIEFTPMTGTANGVRPFQPAGN